MHSLIVLLAASTVGIEAGWEPLPTGGHEYTIQIEPSLLSVLQGGNDLVSEVPAQIDVRRFRILVGTGTLARVDGAGAADATGVATTPASPLDDPLASDDATPPETSEPTPSQPPEFDSPAAPSAAGGPTIPAAFDEPAAGAEPLSKADEPSDAQPHNTERPQLEGAPGAATTPSKPWMPFVVAAVLLACSLGANFFLGWIYLGARSRYRDALAKLRAAPAAG